jgi:hypothetical protein
VRWSRLGQSRLSTGSLRRAGCATSSVPVRSCVFFFDRKNATPLIAQSTEKKPWSRVVLHLADPGPHPPYISACMSGLPDRHSSADSGHGVAGGTPTSVTGGSLSE